MRERRGMLMLLRSAGGAGFDRAHAALARKFAMLASHALAARNASQSEAESQNLRALTEQLHRSKQHAQRNADLLNEIVSLLPISLTVQDDSGRFTLVNDVAATYMGQPAKDLIGVSPFDAHPEPTAVERWQRALQEVGAGQAVATDQKRVTAQGERTLPDLVQAGSHFRRNAAAVDLARHHRAQALRGTSSRCAPISTS